MLVVRGSNQVKGIFFASEKDFSGISEAAVSLMVSHIIRPGICVLPSQTTMRACARVVVIETDCLNWQLQRPVGRPNGHRPLPLIDYTCFTRVFSRQGEVKTNVYTIHNTNMLNASVLDQRSTESTHATACILAYT